MEIKINKEIRDFTENVYFGLSLRQFICTLLACLMAIIIYFSLKKYIGIDILSWLCMIGAFPFIALGFIKYNGMNFEELVFAFVKSEILTPKHLCFKPINFYNELVNNKKETEVKYEISKHITKNR